MIAASRSKRPAEPREEVFFEATARQREFFDALLSGKYRIMALGGAIRGTKTFAVLSAIILLARIFPRSRWAIVRQDLPTIRRTIIPSFEKLRPASFIGSLHQATWTYPCANGSEILLFPESAPRDHEHNRWRGLEVNGFALEEANELQDESYEKAKERAGSWIIPPTPEERHRGIVPEQPPPIILLTFNPSDGYVRREFYDPHKAGTLAPPMYFLPLTPRDNPYVTAEQWAIWRKLPPMLYRRFIEGDWGAITQPNQLIPYPWIEQALSVPHVPGPAREAVDVARYGDDDTVWAHRIGNTFDEIESRRQLSITETSTLSQQRLVRGRIAADQYRVDAVGLGAGVADNMHAAGFAVREFVAGAKPVPRVVSGQPRELRRPDGTILPISPKTAFKFHDLRSQAWWEFAEHLRNGERRFDIADKNALAKLIADLTAVRYEIRSDLEIRIESKDTIKLRIGRSTDYGDAVVMCDFDMPELPMARPLPGSYSGRA